MITMLESRRLEARAYDEQQRLDEQRASQVLVQSKPRHVVTTPAQAPISDEDRLSSLLLGDTKRLATVEDLHAVIAYFDEQLSELRAEIETSEIE